MTDETNNVFLCKCGLDSEILNPTYSIQTPYIKMAKYASSYWADRNAQKSMKTSRQKLFNTFSFAFHFLRRKNSAINTGWFYFALLCAPSDFYHNLDSLHCQNRCTVWQKRLKFKRNSRTQSTKQHIGSEEEHLHETTYFIELNCLNICNICSELIWNK